MPKTSSISDGSDRDDTSDGTGGGGPLPGNWWEDSRKELITGTCSMGCLDVFVWGDSREAETLCGRWAIRLESLLRCPLEGSNALNEVECCNDESTGAGHRGDASGRTTGCGPTGTCGREPLTAAFNPT